MSGRMLQTGECGPMGEFLRVVQIEESGGRVLLTMADKSRVLTVPWTPESARQIAEQLQDMADEAENGPKIQERT